MTREELEQDILSNVNSPEQGMKIPAILIPILVSVISSVVAKFVESCLDKEKVSNFSNLNRIQSMFLKQVINKEIKKHPELNQTYSPKIYNAFVKTGEKHPSEHIYSALKGTK